MPYPDPLHCNKAHRIRQTYVVKTDPFVKELNCIYILMNINEAIMQMTIVHKHVRAYSHQEEMGEAKEIREKAEKITE